VGWKLLLFHLDWQSEMTPTETGMHETTAHAPSSAFASYSSKDAEVVTRSLSTLVHLAPTLDIFQDCLDLTPNEAFKPQLEVQIGKARCLSPLLVASCERFKVGVVGV
jgi:hypothetical protein